jgi:hypothetical protein
VADRPRPHRRRPSASGLRRSPVEAGHTSRAGTSVSTTTASTVSPFGVGADQSRGRQLRQVDLMEGDVDRPDVLGPDVGRAIGELLDGDLTREAGRGDGERRVEQRRERPVPTLLAEHEQAVAQVSTLS